MHICLNNKSIKIQHYLANFEYFRNGSGPCRNTSSAVSENPSDGIFAFLHMS